MTYVCKNSNPEQLAHIEAVVAKRTSSGFEVIRDMRHGRLTVGKRW
jgi:hypothetical protein